MAGETIITVVGNLVDDPELRFTPSGAAVANFRIASTPRFFDKQSNDWKDGEALFLSCSVWRQAAENVAESLQKGMRVVVQGRLKQRQYETREGEKRTVDRARGRRGRPVAEVRDRQGHPGQPLRRGGGYGQGGGQQQSGGGDDPWATPAPQQGGGRPAAGGAPAQGGAPQQDPWGAPGVSSDEPPF